MLKKNVTPRFTEAEVDAGGRNQGCREGGLCLVHPEETLGHQALALSLRVGGVRDGHPGPVQNPTEQQGALTMAPG